MRQWGSRASTGGRVRQRREPRNGRERRSTFRRRPGAHLERGWDLFDEQAIGLAVKGPERVQDEMHDCRRGHASVLKGQLPVPRYTAPRRVALDDSARALLAKRLTQEGCIQWTHLGCACSDRPRPIDTPSGRSRRRTLATLRPRLRNDERLSAGLASTSQILREVAT
jgi:hypothetical protein